MTYKEKILVFADVAKPIWKGLSHNQHLGLFSPSQKKQLDERFKRSLTSDFRS